MSIIIRLQNLPWEANSMDIRRYFQGLSIPDGGVHIVGGEKGDAFIAFSSDEDARQAMERDGGMIKDSRVKLYLSSRNEMQKVIEQARNQTLRIKGNDPIQPTNAGPVGHNPYGSTGGMNERGYESAISTKHGYYMGDRRVDVMPLQGNLGEDYMRSNLGGPTSMGPGPGSQSIAPPSMVKGGQPVNRQPLPYQSPPPHEYLQPPPPMGGIGQPPLNRQPTNYQSSNDILPPPSSHGGTGPPINLPPVGYQASSHEVIPPPDYVVYMKGIPYNSCTGRDVSDFFMGIRIVDMVFEIDGRTGKPAGNAFVEFASSVDFDAALELNMKHMGRRYIELFPATKEDMNEARLGASGFVPASRKGGVGSTGAGVGGGGSGSGGSGSASPTYCISVTNLPPTVTNRDLTNYFSEIGAQPFAIHIMLAAHGLNAGEAFVEFSTKDQQVLAIRQDGSYMGGQRISVRQVPHDLMRRVVGIPPPPGAPGSGPVGHGPPLKNGGMDVGPIRRAPSGDMGGDPRKMRRTGGRNDGFRIRRDKEIRRV